MALDHERRTGLLAAKLASLVRERWGAAERRPATLPGAVALVEQDRAWVLADEHPARMLGAALLFAGQAGIDEVHVLAERETDVLARRAAAFVNPPAVWRVQGRELVAVTPAPPPPEPPLAPSVAEFAGVLRAAGLDPVVEHGVLTGELLGLEVARVVEEAGEAYLEVGVGKHDREAQRLIHGDVPAPAALAAAVETVRHYRRLGAEPHPLNRLARERWLRAVIVDAPDLVGAAHLVPVPSPVRRDDLRKAAPAPAAGEDLEGRPLLVVCSTGIDVDLVPAAADARLADGRDPRLVLVMPERDDHPVTRRLAAALRDPAEVVSVPAAVWSA